MTRPQQKIVFPFPISGITELGPYEGQPERTTPNAKNVRGFAWVDNNGTPERGRLGGGQRPGIRNFHAGGNVAQASGGVANPMQDIVHISSDSVEIFTGRDEMPFRSNSASKLINITKDLSLDFGVKESDETVAGTVWDGDNNLFVAVITATTAQKIDVRKFTRDSTESQPVWTEQWASSTYATDVDGVGSGNWFLQGIAWYGKYVYLRCKRSAPGSAWAEVILTVEVAATTSPTLTKFIDDNDDGVGKGDRGWTTPGVDIQNNGLAIAKGRMAILSRGGTDDRDMSVFVKLVGTGENVAAVSTTTASSGTNAAPRDITADVRGNFWAVGKDGAKSLLIEVSRDGGTPTEHVSVEVDASEETNNVPSAVCYDAISDRVFVVGKTNLFDTGGSFAAYHSNTKKMDFNSGNVGLGVADQIKNLRSLPFSKNDLVKLTTTGTVPASDGDTLVDGTTYKISAVATQADGLFKLTLQLTGGGSVDVTDTGTSGEIFTLTRELPSIAKTTAGDDIAFEPRAEATWNSVRPRTGGGAWLIGTSKSTQLQKSNIDTATAGSSATTTTAATGYKMGSNSVYSLDSDIRSGTRQSVLVVVAGGTVKRATGTGRPFPDVENGDYALSTSEPVIFSAPYGKEIYYVDGLNSKYYSHEVTDAGIRGSMSDWDVEKYDGYEIDQYGLINATAGKTKGLFPVDGSGNKPRLVEVWDERIVLSGIIGLPQEWYMSRRGDPMDFDYFVQPVDDEVAVAGVNSPAGLVPDKINSIVPYSDDLLLFGGDHSIYQLSGNPAMGGSIDILSSVVGMAWGRAWCKDPSGVLYFFGSRGGVFQMAPGRPPQNVTTQAINERLVGINLQTNIIRMAWNDREQGFHVFVSPADKTQTHEHYFCDTRTGAWWVDEFETTDSSIYVHNTTCPHVFDGDDPSDRVLLLGGRDGRLYKWDISAQDDYLGNAANAIKSHVFMGPLNNSDGTKIALTELGAILAANSDMVDYDVYVGRTAEEILAALGTTSDGDNVDGGHLRFSGSGLSGFAAGKGRPDRRRAIAGDIFVKLKNETVGESWALERLFMTIGEAGRRTHRSFDSGRKA